MGLIITLIFIGLVLLLTELLLIPGVGVAGVVGIISLAGANFLAFAFHPHPVGAIVLVVTMFICITGTWYALQAKTWKRLSLKHEIEAKALPLPHEQGIVVGTRGKTLGRLIPSGKARMGDVDVEVYAFEGVIDPGTEIEVVQIDNLRIFVVPVVSASINQ